MKKFLFQLIAGSFLLVTTSAQSTLSAQTQGKGVEFFPINHASFVMKGADASGKTLTFFVDPVGKAEQYENFGTPDIILITHEHGDHYNAEILGKLKGEKTEFLVTKVVGEKLGYGKIVANGEAIVSKNVKIDVLPAYNITPERSNFHKQGVGNGYLVTLGGKRIYIAGDTEDIPEMRGLKNIDYAFIPINLPYTMDPAQAASGVAAFAPKVVYPYHFRSTGDNVYLNAEKFRDLLKDRGDIKVEILKWY